MKNKSLFGVKKIVVYTDGGARGNPGPAAIGVVIAGKEYGECVGERTNNQAEYAAVVLALKKLKQTAGKKVAKELEVEVRMDSELVAKQLDGEYKILEKDLQVLFVETWNLKLDFKEVRFVHIPREANKKADAIVNAALDGKMEAERSRAGFSLMELTVVLFILLTLFGLMLIFLDPSALVGSADDVTRVSHLQNIDAALSIYIEGVGPSPMGGNSLVYISIPDVNPNCAGNLPNLPVLPAGWGYRCATPQNHTKVDGTGWIPVDFTKIPGGSPFGELPVDPRNDAVSGLYYTYATGGSWELTALLERDKNATRAINDGGLDPAMYEVGTNLALTPFARGMVGYWNFDDTAAPLKDLSGWNHTATLIGGSLTFGVPGKLGDAISFNGTNNYASVQVNRLWFGNTFTIAAWLRPGGNGTFLSDRLGFGGYHAAVTGAAIGSYLNICGSGSTSVPPANNGQFHFYSEQRYPSSGSLYLDGVLQTSWKTTSPCIWGNTNPLYIGGDPSTGSYYAGILDEMRIYNRVVSAGVLKEMYNETK